MKTQNQFRSLALTVSAAILLGLTGSLYAENAKKVPEPPKTHADVPYDAHERTVLDFWQAEGEGPRPLVMVIHGGGWLGGDKSRFSGADYYLKNGISVAAISYRLAKTDPLPTPVHDAARALQFLRYKAADWNIDKNRIVLTGDSAGGCSSLWIACHDDLANPDSEDPVERESTRVLGAGCAGAQVSIEPAVIKSWVGPFGLHGMIYGAVGEPSLDALQGNFPKHEAVFKEFSPINHLSKDDPPVYLAYSGDLTLPASSYGHAIHHGVFGVKFKEKSEAVGHNQVHLAAGDSYKSTYSGPRDFVTKTLLGAKQ